MKDILNHVIEQLEFLILHHMAVEHRGFVQPMFHRPYGLQIVIHDDDSIVVKFESKKHGPTIDVNLPSLSEDDFGQFIDKVTQVLVSLRFVREKDKQLYPINQYGNLGDHSNPFEMTDMDIEQFHIDREGILFVLDQGEEIYFQNAFLPERV